MDKERSAYNKDRNKTSWYIEKAKALDMALDDEFALDSDEEREHAREHQKIRALEAQLKDKLDEPLLAPNIRAYSHIMHQKLNHLKHIDVNQ